MVADIIDLARTKASGADRPPIAMLGYLEPRSDLTVLPIEDIRSEYYLRILVDDKLGVMAKITSCLQDAGISIEAVIQKERVSQTVSIVILTDTALEADLNKALTSIESLDVVSGKINRIRVASLAK